MPSPEGPPESLEAGLNALSRGEPGALGRVLPLVYSRLRSMAEERMGRERAGHTLQPTALVHEAFLKLGSARVAWQNEEHFFAVAARAMRQVLIDHARQRGRDKRGGDRLQVSLEDAERVPQRRVEEIDILDLEDALTRLADQDATGASIAEMRFFAGMEIEAIARYLGVTDRTVRRHWVYAKAWLARDMAGSSERRRGEDARA